MSIRSGTPACAAVVSILASLAATRAAQPDATQPAPRAAVGEYRIIGAGITGASQLRPDANFLCPLELDCSDPELAKAFDWAKRQALAYARNQGDPVGPWIEGGEPGRESFCMRDISHQAMGAHALGLDRNIHNMMHRFAENIAESRDWCSYWGMTRQNQPRRVDYKDDAHFWYCLPANFDDLDCCYRMYLWSGDDSYLSDPVFLNFYDRSTHDYVERWGLGIDQIAQRPRLLNIRGIFDPADKFQPNRGLPGYDEQNHEYTLGIDLVAKQYAAYRDYACIEELRGNPDEAQTFLHRAAAVRNLANTLFWNDHDQAFYLRLNQDHKPEGRSGPILLLNNMVDDPVKIKAALADAGPDVLYRWGDADAATAKMLEIARGENRARREYPEVSYSWVGNFVNGTMGITLEAPQPDDAWTKGFWVQAVLRTQSGLGAKIASAELHRLPVRDNDITVRHEGLTKTTVSNNRGPAFIWQAVFAGSHGTLLVNGKPMPARTEIDALDRPTSSVRVTMGAGDFVTVEVPK